MEIYFSLAGVLGVLLIGAISPGPSFVIVARTSIAVSRIDGLFMALGMGVGGALFSILVLAGLHALLASVPWFYLLLKIAGGLYLIYLAIQMWFGANKPIVIKRDEGEIPKTALKSFLLALFTQLSNPKAVVIYGSVFAALLPQELSLSATLVLPLLVFLVEAGWYTVVAVTLSSKSSTMMYLNFKASIDRIASVVMGSLGLKLISEAKVNY